MNGSFAETLRRLRDDRGLTQDQPGKHMFVTHSTKRLELMCSGSMSIQNRKGGGIVVTVTIPDHELESSI